MFKSKMSKRMSDNKIRIEWVDVARGILILCVCLGHRSTTIPNWLSKWIYTFHMPAFFMLSGYLTNFSSLDFKSFLQKKIKQLIVPYCVLGAIYIISFTLFNYFYYHEITILSYVELFFSGHGIGSTWFLLTLFFVEIVAWVLHRLETRLRISLVILITVIGLYYNSIIDIQPIFNLAAIPVGLFFFEVAWEWKQESIQCHQLLAKIKRGGVFTLAFLMVGSIIGCYCNSKIDMYYTNYGNIALFLLGAFCGTGLIIYLSKFIVKRVKPLKNFFRYFGKNTLPIIAFHYPLGYMILETLAYKIFIVPYGHTVFSDNIEGIIYAIAIMLLMIPVIEALNKFFPWAVGKEKNGK